MDLWIRSQNRKMMEKAVAVKIAHYKENGKTTNSIVINNDYIFGEYATEERALEVLDEIQSFLENNYISIDDMPSHSNFPYPGYYPTHISTMYRKKVFKMPKE